MNMSAADRRRTEWLVLALGAIALFAAGAVAALAYFSATSPSEKNTFTAAAVHHITISPTSSTITAGGSQAYTTTAFDVSNNSFGDVTASTSFAISPDGSCTTNSCSATVAGAHTVTATFWGLTATSSLTVNPSTATHLVFTQSPANTAAAATFTTQPKVAVEDQFNNVVTGSSASITLSIATQPASGATIACTANPVAASAGVATFTGCAVTGQAGSYTLGAAATSLTPATSSAFTISTALSASPVSGTVGQTGVTLTGNGYTPAKSVSVTFGGAALTVSPASPTVAANGSWTATFTVPASTNGARTITATDNAASPLSASTTFTVNAALAVSPASGAVATPGVTLTGSGYTAGASITSLTFNGATLAVAPATPLVSATGSWSATFTVPASSNGAQTITATDNAASPASASTVFTVGASLTVAPASGIVGASGVTLTGSGYTATKSISVTFGGTALTVSPATPTVAANGSWTATFSVPASSNGAQTIVATDNASSPVSASTTFTVNASLSVSPSSGIVGQTATLTGNGYTGGKSITSATFGGAAITLTPATPVVAANGSWSATFTVPASSNGAQTISAHDNATAPVSASTSFTVNASLSAAPSSGPVGATGVTLTGNGYTGGKSITSVTFGGVALAVSPATPAVAANGSWSATFTVPAAGNGVQTITAADNATSPVSASATFTVNASLSVLPSSGVVGATGVTLTGSGYSSGKSITSVTFGGAALTVSPATPTVAANGSWTATFSVPASGNGAQTITAIDNATSPISASTTFTVGASLSVLPTSGTVGTSGVTLTGNGYTATKSISVTFGGAALTVTPATPTVAANGSWTATFAVPAGSNGAQTITAADNATTPASASTTFTVDASATGLSPATGAVGSSATIVAQGFKATSALTVTVGGVSATVTGGSPTNGSGSATGTGSTLTFTIPALANGAHQVVVSDGTNTATSATNFTVLASVSASPSSGVSGQTGVTLTGAGYITGKTVSATFAGSALALTPATPTVAADGSWTATFTVPSTTTGSKTIAATDTGGATASTTFSVFSTTVLGSAVDTAGDKATSVTGVATTSGATELILVYRESSITGDAVSSITGPFTANATQVSVNQDFAANKSSLFAYRATGNGTSGTVTVNFSGNNKNIVTVVDVIQLSGNDTGTPIVQFSNASGTSASATASLSNPAAGDPEIILIGPRANTTVQTPAGFSQLDAHAGTTGAGYDFKIVFGPAETSTSSTLGASATWGTIALEIKHG